MILCEASDYQAVCSPLIGKEAAFSDPLEYLWGLRAEVGRGVL